MRKTWVIIFIMLYSVVQAQIVPIPDSQFKSRLLASSPSNPIAKNQYSVGIKVDVNNDGQIQVTEAQAVVYLDLTTDLITNLSGLSYFSNIKELYNGNGTLTSVTISLPKLEYLIVGGNAMTALDISACPKLDKMVLRYNGSTLSLNNNSVKTITLTGGSNLQNINLQGFTALKDFTLQQGSNVQSVNGSNMPSLESAFLSYAPVLSQINFTGSPNFKSLSVITTGLPSLDLTNYTSLETVAAQVNTFSTVKFDGCTSLLKAMLYDNTISNSNISMNGANALETLFLKQCNLTSLALNNLPSLKDVDLSDNHITNLNLSNLPSLEKLNVTSNLLSSLDLTNTVSIKTLISSHNKLSNLNVAPLTQLMNLQCDYNALIQLDLSNNKNLSQLACHNNPNLEQIFLKNGGRQYSAFMQIYPNPKLQYICCDDQSELMDFIDYTSANGNPNTIVNSYCYFTPGNALYTIQGNIKYDSDNNGCDSNDPGKGFQRFTITSGNNTGTIIANDSGNYVLPVQEGSHTIKPVLENPYFTVTPASYTVTFPAQTSPVTQNFCLAANGIHNDLETVIIPLTAAAPGFDSKYKIIYKNKGTASQSGNINFTFNDDLMNYLNATTVPDSQSTGTLHWNFTNLLPFEKREIILTFKLNSPTQSPALNSGDVLSYNAQIIGATDETPADNNFILNQTVVNSFDPNDKTCLEGTSITQTQIGDYVHYLIRFENTGTANARNILVKDVIDTSKFDLATLVPLDASHTFITKITNPNVVEFVFDNIQLPFDDAHNDGYISFKIKTKSTLVSGSNFSNTAKIYFDYNAPVITNTYTTSVEGTLATAEVKNDKYTIGIYPNPVQNVLYIKSSDEVIKAKIYDTAGRLINSMGTKGNTADVSNLSKGNYWIKLFLKDKTSVQKFIKN
ncbi:T9SS type A sorting domain-containing protein [Chryseobacterium lactis]|uniref:DUF7619 domain-containing protein n=1 Tax=Chryseobacterium lactis TaxID=1241981 RepID=UPI0016286810|nr:T9SS type A sorting domain-containing protein [Chryseobacterium lactis]